MGNSHTDLADRYSGAKWHWGVAYMVSALFWVLPLLILVNLRHGLDLADTGHYYNSLSQFPDIQSMSTQYFLFWDMLPVGEGVYENRLWVFGLFFVAGGVFSFGLTRFLKLDYRRTPENFIVFFSAWASVFLYYFWWLPDPSYNAVAIILLYGLSGLLMWVTAIARAGSYGRFLYGLCVLSGFLLVAFALTRPTSAIVFSGLAIGFYGPNMRPIFSRQTLLLIGFSLIGGLLFLAVVQIFIEPLSVTYNRQLAGLEMRNIRNRQIKILSSIIRFFVDIKTGAIAYWPWLFAGITGAVFSKMKYIHSKVIKHVLLLMSCIGFVGMAAQFSVHFMDGEFAKDVEISTYLSLLALSLAVIVMLIQIQNKEEKAEMPKGTLSALALVILLPYCFAFGTGNLWMKQSLLAGGFTVAACLVLLQSTRKILPIYWTASALAAILFVPFAVYVLAQNKPYRLPEPLAAQNIPVSIHGKDGGTLFVDKTTAKFLDDFTVFYEQFGPEDNRAHLIDMSGMSPFLHYHLDAKIMTVPWLIATEENSQATFEFILARMNADELRTAWVITAPDNKRHLDGAALRAIGLNFPEDYELVLTTRPPLSKKDIHLYRPKANRDP